jgi:hypothetical protein
MAHKGLAWNDTAETVSNAIFHVGYAGWDSIGTLTQGSVQWCHVRNALPAQYRANVYVSSDHIAEIIGNDTLDGDDFHVTARSSTSFTVAADNAGSGGAYDFGWFAFSDTAKKKVVVSTEKFSTGTGSQNFTGYDGTIESILTAGSVAATQDSLITNFAASGVSAGGGVSSTEEFGIQMSGRDGNGDVGCGTATWAIPCEGYTFSGTPRSNDGELTAGAFGTDDQITINKVASVAAYCLVMGIAEGAVPLNDPTVVIRGNATVLGNTTLAGA